MIIADSGHIILSAIQPETVSNRIIGASDASVQPEEFEEEED